MKTTPLLPIMVRVAVIVGLLTTITNQRSKMIISMVGTSVTRNRAKILDTVVVKEIEITATRITVGMAIEIIRAQAKAIASGTAETPNEALQIVIKTTIKDGMMAGVEDIAVAVEVVVVAEVVEIMETEKEETGEEITTVTEVVINDARGQEKTMTTVIIDDRNSPGMVVDISLGSVFDTNAHIRHSKYRDVYISNLVQVISCL